MGKKLVTERTQFHTIQEIIELAKDLSPLK
jgi:5-methylthioribose kinase